MKINLDYKIKFEKGDELSNQEVTFNYISIAVNQKYKDGIESTLRRVWSRIQRKFDEAIEAKADTVTLEEAEQDFVKKCFDECKFHPSMAMFVSLLEDEISSWAKK